MFISIFSGAASRTKRAMLFLLIKVKPPI